MSSDEESEEEETMSLDDIQNEFKAKVGNAPHSVQQMLAFCKQNKYPQKFKDINQWWPNRPDPEEKPKQKAVNADDYKDPNAQGGNDDNSENDDDEEEQEEAPKEEPKAEEPAAEPEQEDEEEEEEEEEEDDF
mmetsp:Transcript_43792/g.39012  ORF Transcript_43792/g.39012 Transcript_43792/m.39012 type:complete len:133 (-) Transcript_43792:17-415(-)